MRKACGHQQSQDLVLLKLLSTLEGCSREAKARKAKATRVQTSLYWLKVGDTQSKVFFKSLREKKDMELITHLSLDGRIITNERMINQ